MNTSFRLSAVGDISFEGREADRPSIECFRAVAPSFHRSDLVVGNLECVLTRQGDAILGKCTLRGSPEWASEMRTAGIDLVSLANNHVMDYGQQGLFSTIDALNQAGIRHVGAGRNLSEACAPLFVGAAGLRIAFLARSAVIVSSPTYAGDDDPGVAFLDIAETEATVRSCRLLADVVVLLLHWGIEEYSYPSPVQRQVARQLVDAGANIILGHHPHVLQGFEYYRSAPIVYSLGNFAFDEFEWTCVSSEGTVLRQVSPLSPDNRKGLIATLDWSVGNAPTLATTYTRLKPDIRLEMDTDLTREVEMKNLSNGILRRWYDFRWRLYAIHREWDLRLGDQMSFGRIVANLHRVRLRHLTAFFGSLRRSVRIASGKSTNPYE